jgi:hypothetical protein
LEGKYKTNEEVKLPIPGKGQIANIGYTKAMFLKGELVNCFQNFSGFVFSWKDLGEVIFLRRNKYTDILELSSEEEELFYSKLRDFSQSLSIELYVGEYNIGSKRSISINEIEKYTEKYLYDVKKDSEVDDDDEYVNKCGICLEEFENGDECRKILKCNHYFCKNCIEKWLLRCFQCPLCRIEISN